MSNIGIKLVVAACAVLMAFGVWLLVMSSESYYEEFRAQCAVKGGTTVSNGKYWVCL